MPPEQAFGIIEGQRGRHLCPAAVDALAVVIGAGPGFTADLAAAPAPLPGVPAPRLL